MNKQGNKYTRKDYDAIQAAAIIVGRVESNLRESDDDFYAASEFLSTIWNDSDNWSEGACYLDVDGLEVYLYDLLEMAGVGQLQEN